MNQRRSTAEGELFFESTIEVDGQAVACPRLDQTGIFQSSCSTWVGNVNGIRWEISGGSSIISFPGGEPREFVVRRVIRSLRTDGQWDQTTIIETIVPGDDPNPPDPGDDGGGGGGGGGGTGDPDLCLVPEPNVHERPTGGGGGDDPVA